MRNRSIEVPVEFDDGSRPIKFYPVSVGHLQGLRSIGAELAKSITTLFSMKSMGVGTQTIRSIGDKSKPETLGEETVIEAPSQTTIKYRLEERNKAIDAAFNCLFHEQNLLIVAGLIADSMRDEGLTAEEIVKLDLDLVVELCTAVLKANAKSFPKRFQTIAEKVRDQMTEALGGERPSSSPTPTEESDSSPKSSDSQPPSTTPSDPGS